MRRDWIHLLVRLAIWILILFGCCEDGLSQNGTETTHFRPSTEDFEEQPRRYEAGISSCPCLRLGEDSIRPIEHTDESLASLGSSVDLTTYGFGCAKHDETSQTCQTNCEESQLLTPTPIGCDRSWCKRNWCWVDPDNCNVFNKRSAWFGYSDRYYSYATCWDMDEFTQKHRFASLQGKTLKVGFNSNSGGWQGAYSSAKKSFEGPASRWSGPAVAFVTEAARVSRFWIQLTEPPEFLRNFSYAYFGPSSFDFCVYNTALGFLDMCVAQYTLTDQRASTADWLILGSQELRVVIDSNHGNEATSWQHFQESFETLFLPFTGATWGFVILFVVPVLGCLMVVHEYGKTGSAYPRTETVVEFDGQRQEIKAHRQPMIRHLMRSVYITALSVFHQDYSQPLVTAGAMLNLLGISFFILTIIAVYTANLASILAQERSFVGVSGLDEAIDRGYRICAERKNMEVVQSLYRNLKSREDVFLVDPVDLGGDGSPGFTCCGPRLRVFEMLDPVLARSDSRYCHVAIAPLEDLEVEQANRKYCHLRAVGNVVGEAQTGIPVYDGVSAEVTSLFLKMKQEGLLDKELKVARPETACPVSEGGEGTPLTVEQLSGLWVITFGFAALGLIVTFVTPWVKRRQQVERHAIIAFDQKGNPVNMMEQNEGVWMQELERQSTRRTDTKKGPRARERHAPVRRDYSRDPLTSILEED